MTFDYCYKTSDGQRHEGTVDAPGRDEAFAALRRQGIRPIRLSGAEDRRPAGGRWQMRLAVAVLSAAVVLLAVMLYRARRASPPDGSASASQRRGIESQVVEVPSGGRVARPRARKPISGMYPFTQELGELFAAAFEHPAEAYLARFAQPGLEVPPLAEGAAMELLEDDLQDALDDPIVIRAEDPRSVAELKRIVSGLKEEVSLLLASGKSLGEVRSWLEGRQRMEAAYRKQIIRRVDDGLISLDEANSLLVSMGFAPKGK